MQFNIVQIYIYLEVLKVAQIFSQGSRHELASQELNIACQGKPRFLQGGVLSAAAFGEMALAG